MNENQYATDQRIRAAVRRAVQAINYHKGSVARSVIADDTLDFLEDNTAKIDGRLVNLERVGLDPGGCPLYREKWEASE